MVQAPLLAEALLAAGRTDEARVVLSDIADDRTPRLVPWQVKWRIAQARIEARGGADGTALAREAVTLAEHSDDPTLTGEALTALAETLELGGQRAEARATLERASDAFERKGNLAAARAISGGALRPSAHR
jgi:predicted Zn-dependent protease